MNSLTPIIVPLPTASAPTKTQAERIPPRPVATARRAA
jgi:hypothetical protein